VTFVDCAVLREGHLIFPMVASFARQWSLPRLNVRWVGPTKLEAKRRIRAKGVLEAEMKTIKEWSRKKIDVQES